MHVCLQEHLNIRVAEISVADLDTQIMSKKQLCIHNLQMLYSLKIMKYYNNPKVY